MSVPGESAIEDERPADGERPAGGETQAGGEHPADGEHLAGGEHPADGKPPVGGDTSPERMSLREQARLLAEERDRRARWQAATGAAAALVVVLAVVLAITVFTGGDDERQQASAGSTAGPSAAAVPTEPAPGTAAPRELSAAEAATVIQLATSVPAATLDKVGRGQAQAAAQPVSDQPALAVGGKPLLLYVGAEYCPYCASQRWAVVVALSRFGTFRGLSVTHSASDDIYPDTQTMSFHGATYTSRYVAFQGVETASNERQGDSYGPLDTLTPRQQQIFETMDSPPYVPQDSAGAIPFLDLGNKYVIVGSTYDVRLLQGKSAAEIAKALHDPADPIGRGVHGAANYLTALICQLTGGKPAQVCTSAAVKAFANRR